MYDDEDFEPEKEDIDFEIAFYEGLINKKPDFTQALMALGDLYTKKGMFKEGLKIDEYLSQLRPADPYVHYNLACSYSLLNEMDKAFRSIKKAINYGYRNFSFLKEDHDLENLRNDNRFKRYFARIERKLSKDRHEA